MATTLFMRLGEAASAGLTLPSGFYGSSLSPVNTAASGANAKALDATAGSTQVSSTVNSAVSTFFAGLAQFCSPALSAATYAAQTASVGFAIQSSVSTNTTPRVSVYLVNGATGAVRTTLVSGASCGTLRNRFAETTCFSAGVSLAGFTASDGDYLVVEVLAVPAGTSNITVFADGTTAPSGDGIATSSARSFITLPLSLTFIPPIVSGPAALGAGSGLAGPGAAQIITEAGPAALGAGTGLDAAGTAVVTPALLYLRFGESAPAGSTLPAGFLASATLLNAAASGANAKALDLVAGSGQVGIALAAVSTSRAGIAQAVSRPMGAQTIPAGHWTVAFAGSSNTTPDMTYQVSLYLLNGATGLSRQLLINLNSVGSSPKRGTAEATVYQATFAIGALTIVAGDTLDLEILGIQTTATTTITVYADGTAPIHADNVATSNAGSYLQAPATLTFAVLSPAGLAGGAALDAAGTAVLPPVGGPAALGAGAALSAAGAVQVLTVGGPGELDGGASLSGQGSPAVVGVGQTPAPAAGSLLAGLGASLPALISGIGELDAGAALAGQGAPTVVAVAGGIALDAGAALDGLGAAHVLGVGAGPTFDAGSTLVAAGSPGPSSLAGSGSLDSGASLSGPAMIPVMGSADLAAGAQLAGQGSVGGAVSGVGSLQSGAAIAGQGSALILVVLVGGDLFSGTALQAGGLPAPAVVGGPAELAGGSGVAAPGSPVAAAIAASSQASSGSALASSGAAVAVGAGAEAGLTAGSALSGVGLLLVPARAAGAALLGGSALVAGGQGLPIPVLAPADLGAGSLLAGLGSVLAAVVEAPASLAAGSLLAGRGSHVPTTILPGKPAPHTRMTLLPGPSATLARSAEPSAAVARIAGPTTAVALVRQPQAGITLAPEPCTTIVLLTEDPP